MTHRMPGSAETTRLTGQSSAQPKEGPVQGSATKVGMMRQNQVQWRLNINTTMKWLCRSRLVQSEGRLRPAEIGKGDWPSHIAELSLLVRSLRDFRRECSWFDHTEVGLTESNGL